MSLFQTPEARDHYSLKRLLQRLLVAFLLLSSVPAFALTEQEIADLQFMREEEKLAYDIYNALYALWGNPVFTTIASSEARHKDSVLNLLNQFGIADPAAGMAAGKFSSTALQSLYDQLLASGSVSQIEGLRVGVTVEKTDIADLDQTMAHTTNASILRVYSNLRKGSVNHLSSFSNQILALGGTVEGSGQNPGLAVYEPISQSLYIPAVVLEGANGEKLVYDALLRLVETMPVTLQLVNSTLTSIPYSADYASYSSATGIVTIPELAVGALNYSTLEAVRYSATLQLQTELSAESPTFTQVSLSEK
ncbi:MAG: DUF2202 domain-containing protein [Pseudomonadales bacterium]|nr:DUF2202 domain-containing protein [Pseudomonadales bacterium]MCP5330005.1 DUF2202 domain-containing protein [Pseudomonadales bacterium]MCP5343087.1 DUF2202 domain-containing protein [Pseudomonadales bacterium]